MTLEQAIDKLINSEPFKEKAKQREEGSGLRVFLHRWRKGEIRACTAVDMLQQFGYTIDVEEPKSDL